MANLYGAALWKANLAGANLYNAKLDDVIGTDFTGARGVPKKYLRD